MAKRVTVFYSWQTDTPSSLNRSFVEKAILEALKRLNSDATLVQALRNVEVELDKDTQGVPGSPPIVETILQKIEECAVFVADLTFVGESKNRLKNSAGKPRQFPNPNVLIEYGYALRCHSHKKLIGIMNTAYGKPDAESLPFDLRHLRWPITYSGDADKNAEFEKLVETLQKAIGLILANHSSPTVAVDKFTSHKATKNPAIFFDTASDLAGTPAESFAIPDGAKAYLRLAPVFAVPPINTELEARNLAMKGQLRPLGKVLGLNWERNVFGAISYGPAPDGVLHCLTQLFLSREVWGIDSYVVNADRIRKWLGQNGQDNFPHTYIASGFIEERFVETLQNYLDFARMHLQLTPPLQVEAGLAGIKDYSITIDSNQVRGNSLRDHISWHEQIASYEKPAWEILSGFFDRIWDNCGFQRTAQMQDAYVKKFKDVQW